MNIIDWTTTIIAITLSVVVLVVIWRYRRRMNASISAGGVKLSVSAENDPDPTTPPSATASDAPRADVSLKRVKSRKGGLLVEDEAGGDIEVDDAEVEGDILVSRSGNRSDNPKA